MIRSITLVSLLAISALNGSPLQADDSHDHWLRERYEKAASIKTGMTRADLLKVFRMDGGLQSFLPTRYVLNGSHCIKVDVEFTVPADLKGRIVPEDFGNETQKTPAARQGKSAAGENYQLVPNDKLIIKSISRPYLEPEAYD